VVDTAPELSKAEDSYDSVSMMWTAAQQDDREGNNQRRDDMMTTKLNVARVFGVVDA
jgi:hypothetical protein